LRYSTAPNPIDSLGYFYYAGTNKLRKVTDNVSATTTTVDIDNQTNDENYVYDEIGNLITDKSENITSIKWNVYGKIEEINKTGTASSSIIKIEYSYDPSGNRVGKIVYRSTGLKEYTTYVRDASGNVLGLYTTNGTTTVLSNLVLKMAERHIYGSSRIGAYNNMVGVDGGASDISWYNFWSGRRGVRKFELFNHLGNVLSMVLDKTEPIVSSDNSTKIGYNVLSLSYSSYYPFGMQMVVRTNSPYSATSSRYGFNGMEKDNEAKGDGNSYTTELRQYDPRLGRWLSIDPLVYNFPQQSPYVGYDNNPIYFVDPHGGGSKKNGGGDDDWRKKKFNPQGQRVVATDGENQLIPSNATPLLNDKGQTAGYIGYGNRLFTYVNDGKQKGYIDQEGLHSYYYEREYDIYQQYNGDWRYTAWKVIHTVGGDGAKLLGDPVGYAKDIYKSIQNIDIGKTWEAIQNMSDVEQKNFAGSVIFGLITGSPKKAMWTLGAHSSALRNIASHAVKHAHEFGITGAKTASRYYQAATKFFDAPPPVH